MTSSDLWAIYVAKNPVMGTNDDTHITLTTRGLKKLFDSAYERGHDAGFENGKAWERLQKEHDKPAGDTKDFSNIFGDIFGKKP